jgi:hypothetical protein
MKRLHRYFTPILIVMLVLFIAGCSGAAGGDEEPLLDEIEADSNGSDPFGDLFNVEECEGDECEVDGKDIEECEGGDCEEEEPACEGDECEDREKSRKDRGVVSSVEPLRLVAMGSPKLDEATYGVGYSDKVFLQAKGGTAPYTWLVEGRPEDITFDANKKELEGIPVELGVFELGFSVEDADGVVSDVVNRTITVIDEYAIEFRYNGEPLGEGELIPFEHEILSVHVVDGHANSYTWTVTMVEEAVEYTSSDDSKEISLTLPSGNAAEKQNYIVDVSVVDEFGNEAIGRYSMTRGVDPCAIPLNIHSKSNDSDGIIISATGGKGDYEFNISLDESVILYDLDGNEMEDTAELSEASKISQTIAGAIKGKSDTVNVSTTRLEDGRYSVDVLSFPKISGVSGYRVAVDVEVTDTQCPELSSQKPLYIEKAREMDTLKDLKMVCDFEDIKHAENGDSYLEFDIYTIDGAVAQVRYNLLACNKNEEKCEDERDFKPIEAAGIKLSSVKLSEVTDIRYKVHKKRKKTNFWNVAVSILVGTATVGQDPGSGIFSTQAGLMTAAGYIRKADKKKLDVDVQWCRFYTDSWFAVWDDQKHGNVLNDNEAGGRKRMSNHNSRTKLITDRMEGPGDGNIWFMGDMLDSVASDSEDGFDYMTIKNNDGKD